MPLFFHNVHRRQDGQTLVEFAIAFPIQLMVVLGIIQLSLIFVAKQIVNYAAFSAARAELVKDDDVNNADRDRNAYKAASIICTAIAGPSAKANISVTTDVYPLIRLPGWGLLVPPPPRAIWHTDPEGTNPFGDEKRYLTPERRGESAFVQSGEPDKSSFAQAKTYVYRLDGGTWTCISGQTFAPDPSILPMLAEVGNQLGGDDRAVVVAVAHDYELALPFVGEFFAILSALNPNLPGSDVKDRIPSLQTATERWGAPHITLVDVGVQYKSVVLAEE